MDCCTKIIKKLDKKKKKQHNCLTLFQKYQHTRSPGIPTEIHITSTASKVTLNGPYDDRESEIIQCDLILARRSGDETGLYRVGHDLIPSPWPAKTRNV